MAIDVDVESALAAVASRVRTTHEATGEAFPYVADPETGEWTTTVDGNWCGGHWVGLLRLAGDRLGGETGGRLHAAADAHTDRLVEHMPRDSMFCGTNFDYAGFRGYDRPGDHATAAEPVWTNYCVARALESLADA